ncbi:MULTISPECIES: NAD-dependent DNA ligase [unclassified Alteromonas]|uniref:NAD-dependent DNA ligase n=1 Tax=unclassified Alteromonas TaxID=2614992 RepID=UPI000509AA65|nr:MULTISPECIES: NAD-dependent DNA ligase [unclassified Alteromonas]
MNPRETLDLNGQPINIGISYKRNKAKAVLTLKGIIEGIDCDKDLNKTEEVFLRAWKSNDAFNFKDGDFIDIHEQIDDILEDSVITEEEKVDLISMLDDILEYGGIGGDNVDALVNQLLGFLSGISADENLNDVEIEALNEMLESNDALTEGWPGNALKLRLDEILADGIIDEEERTDLLNLVKAVSGQNLMETGLAYGLSADFSTCSTKCIDLKGVRVCFTGAFVSGSRNKQHERAIQLGAEISKSVNKKLDVLVLGSLASRDWKFSSYGRKVEAVLSNRVEGAKTEIINEESWNELVSSYTE